MLIAQLQWGDFPTWLAAIGTIGAVLVALGLALAEGRRREQANRRRQAESVTAWLDDLVIAVEVSEGSPAPSGLVIQNGSNQLIYQVIANLVVTQGGGTVPRETGYQCRRFISHVPPGRMDSMIDLRGGIGVMTRWGVELVFRDSAGRSWLRGVDGELKELAASPAEHYGVEHPYWQGPGGTSEGS
jgi:hypothetical protein